MVARLDGRRNTPPETIEANATNSSSTTSVPLSCQNARERRNEPARPAGDATGFMSDLSARAWPASR